MFWNRNRTSLFADLARTDPLPTTEISMKARLPQIVDSAWFGYLASVLLSAAVVVATSGVPRTAAGEPVTCIVALVAIAFCAWNLGIGPALVSVGIFVASELWPGALSLEFRLQHQFHRM